MRKVTYSAEFLKSTFAGLVALFLTLGLILLAALGRDIPPSLSMALGSAMTWLFIHATESTNGGPTARNKPASDDRIEAWILPETTRQRTALSPESVGRRSPPEPTKQRPARNVLDSGPSKARYPPRKEAI